MGMDLCFGDDAPPPGPEMDVIRLDKSVQLQVCILSEAIRSVFVHWNQNKGSKGRTEPCFRENCKGCKFHLPRRWKGYIHCHLAKEKKEAFVEVTPGAAEDLALALPNGISLRGLNVILRRQDGKKARMRVDLMPEFLASDPSKLPEEKLPWETLARLWEVPSNGQDFPE